MILLFLHLPKTGGTTLGNCVFGQYGGPLEADEPPGSMFKAGVYYFPAGFFQGAFAPYDDRILANLRRVDLQAVTGHFGYGIDRFLNPGVPFGYGTFLRNPAERIASLYRHIVHFEDPDPELHEKVTRDRVCLHDFATSFSLPELENDQCRRIAGIAGTCTVATLEKAKSRLRDEFAFVGLTERFDESLVLMKRRLGWTRPLQYYAENVSARWRMPKEPLPSRTVEAINERNRYDLELYDTAAKSLTEAVSVESEKGFDDEVSAFRRHNRRMNQEWRRSGVD